MGSDEENKLVSGRIIDDFDEFKAEWEQNATDAAQTVLFFMIGAYHYAQGDTKKGEAMVTVVYPEKDLLKDPKSPSGFKLTNQDRNFMDHLAEQPDIVNSYLGGTPGNGYQIDVNHLVLTVTHEGFDNDWGTVTVQSGGKDFSTPMNVGKDAEGRWKVLEIAVMATGVKPAN